MRYILILFTLLRLASAQVIVVPNRQGDDIHLRAAFRMDSPAQIVLIYIRPEATCTAMVSGNPVFNGTITRGKAEHPVLTLPRPHGSELYCIDIVGDKTEREWLTIREAAIPKSGFEYRYELESGPEHTVTFRSNWVNFR